MLIVDTALEKREQDGNPVKVGIVGAGYMGRGLALQIISAMRGMRLVAISNRTLSEAERAYRQAGVEDIRRVDAVAALEQSIA
ncbi:MAG: Gfo/Idh/MocA family oxidoreductase, partial [Candidatus Binatia bacterium]